MWNSECFSVVYLGMAHLGLVISCVGQAWMVVWVLPLWGCWFDLQEYCLCWCGHCLLGHSLPAHGLHGSALFKIAILECGLLVYCNDSSVVEF